MRYTYIAYPNNRSNLYIHENVCKVKGDSVELYYYSQKRTDSSYIPEVIRFDSNFVSEEGIVLSLTTFAPDCHMFLPETHSLFNSYVILHADGDAKISEQILIEMMYKIYKGVMQEYRNHHKEINKTEI